MKETALRQALNTSIMGCQPSDYWKNHMVRHIVKGEEMKKRTKLSLGVVLVLALLLISAVAFAVTALINEYYSRIAEMEASGVLGRWNLEDKISFVKTMWEYNFDIDLELYQIMLDENNSDEQRETAADQIVNTTYGSLIRQQHHQLIH